MDVKILYVSKDCKNILGVKWEYNNYRCEMGVKKIQDVKWVKKNQFLNGSKNITGVKYV